MLSKVSELAFSYVTGSWLKPGSVPRTPNLLNLTPPKRQLMTLHSVHTRTGPNSEATKKQFALIRESQDSQPLQGP